MAELLSPAAAILLGSLLAAAAVRRYSARERPLLALAFAMHVLAAFAQVWITRGVYGRGDMILYFETGRLIADVVRYDAARFLPELGALLVHRESVWPFYVIGTGGPTGTMNAIAGILHLVWGPSIYAQCLTLSGFAFFGQLALYRVFRELFPSPLWRRLLVATMLVPSVVFWSSGILKETVAMAAFGWIVLGLHRFVQRRRSVGLLLIVVAGFWIALVKPYILFALAAAAGVWWYWRRALEATGGQGVPIRPAYLIASAAAIIALIVILGELFPRYSFERVSEETARLQEVGAIVRGGSYYEVTERPARTLAGQLAYAPFALLAALFRPTIFEVRNATMALNAIETTVMAVLFISAIVRRSWGAMWHQLSRSPTLVFALVFVFTFGVAVGLASTNLGTLSRYRVPLVPFFTVLVLILVAPYTHASAAIAAVDKARRTYRPRNRARSADV